MMGGTIMVFISELGLTIVRGIVPAEEVALPHSIEFHQVAHDMGTHHIVGDAPATHGLYGRRQLLSV